jgi:putative hydrolase of the HAD superfamily
MAQPQVIFFDAVGTLFGVRGSVGEVYSDLARQFGVATDADRLNAAFFQSFRAAPPLAFPGSDVTEIPSQEFDWWKAIAAQSFRQVGAYELFQNFDDFFNALYSFFSTAEPWYLYDDTLSTLEYWRNRGVELGILSNFDSRIYLVLQSLGLAGFFTSVTISTEVGAAKPDPKIFSAALKKHSCSPKTAWHVGDSYREDYEGAKSAGLRAIWLKRSEPMLPQA